MRVEQRIDALGLHLPSTTLPPLGVEIPFAWVRRHSNRVFVSGHGAQAPNGSASGPFGQVPNEVSLDEAQHSGVLATLSMLASLRASLGDLDRVAAWLSVTGYVNAAPGYARTTAVLNPASELIIDVFGPDAGAHARTAIGVAALPLNFPVVIAAELEISGSSKSGV